MASPTWAEAATILKNNIKAFSDHYANLGTSVTNIDTAEQSAEGDFLPVATVGGLNEFRRRMSQTMDPTLLRGIWTAWLREVCRVRGYPETDLVSMAARIHRDMHTNSTSFNSRNVTRGSPSGVTGTGNGTLHRLTVDHEAYALQGGHIETKTFECVQDANNGVLQGQEVFECRGEDASKDLLDYQGSGIRQEIRSMHSGSGEGGTQIQNAGFDATLNGSGTDKIPGWTIAGDETKITRDTTNVFAKAPGASESASLAFASDGAATNQITQALSLRSLNALGERVPWVPEVFYKHSTGTCTGTLNLKWGTKTKAYDLSGLSDTAWHALRADMDEDLYYHNWKENDPDVELEVVNLNTGTLYLDSHRFAPMTLIDHLWWWISGGDTPWLLRDTITAADSGGAAADAEMMFFFHWAFAAEPELWHFFPTDNAGTETITDP